VANHHYFVAVIAGETADDGRIVAERAVAMNFTPVSEEALYVIQREWTLGVARKFRPMPGIDVRADLFPQKVDLVLEMFELEMGFVVLAGPGLKLDDLLLNGFQLPLRFNCWIQENQLLSNQGLRPCYPKEVRSQESEDDKARA